MLIEAFLGPFAVVTLSLFRKVTVVAATNLGYICSAYSVLVLAYFKIYWFMLKIVPFSVLNYVISCKCVD